MPLTKLGYGNYAVTSCPQCNQDAATSDQRGPHHWYGEQADITPFNDSWFSILKVRKWELNRDREPYLSRETINDCTDSADSCSNHPAAHAFCLARVTLNSQTGSREKCGERFHVIAY